jgi:hypothetical protein
MTQTEVLITCANCGRPCREADAKEAGWRYWSNGSDLHVMCSLCSYRDFGSESPAALPAELGQNPSRRVGPAR